MFKNKRLKTAIDINNMIDIAKSKFKLIFIKKNIKTILFQDNGISILDVLLANTDSIIEEAYITTFRIGKKDLSVLKMLLDKKYIKNITLLISDSVRPMTPSAFNYLKETGIKYKELNTHTKMMFLKNEKGNINCFSSGNFNPDGKIEQLSIDNNKNTFDFYKNWIDSL